MPEIYADIPDNNYDMNDSLNSLAETFDAEIDLYFPIQYKAGENIEIDGTTINVVTTNAIEDGNTKPITSQGVFDAIEELSKIASIESIEQTVKAEEDGGINIITIKLTNGTEHTFSFTNGSKGSDGKDGKDGYTPVKGVDYFDGEKGEPGKDGYTPIKGVDYRDGIDGVDGNDGYTPQKGLDYFDGEKGDKGDKGEKGEKGEPGADGKDGVNGKDGADGKTPVKGVDYFTEEEKAEIVDSVTSSLPLGGSVSNPQHFITWDGDITGLETSDNGYYYRISECVPTYDEVRCGGFVKMSNYHEKLSFSSDDVEISVNDTSEPFGFWFGVNVPNEVGYTKQPIYVIPEDNYEFYLFEGEDGRSGIFPKKGIYADSDEYPEQIYINGYAPKLNILEQKVDAINEDDGDSKVADVQIDGTSILDENGVANIPVVTEAGDIGLLKLGSTHEGEIGMIYNTLLQKRFLTYPVATEEALKNEKHRGNIGAGAVDASNFHLANKIAMTNNSARYPWTDDEKATAREKIGAVSLQDVLDNIPDVETVKTDVETLKTNSETLQEDIDEVKTDIETVETDVETIKTDVETIKTDVETIETNVETIETNVETVETDVETLKTNNRTLQESVDDVKTDVEALQKDIDDAKTDVETLQESVADVKTKVENSVKKVVHYYASGSEGSVVLSDTLTWDGNTDGLVSVAMNNMTAYKINGSVPTLEEAQQGGVFTSSLTTTETAFPGEAATSFSDDGLVYAFALSETCQLIVATTDNCEWLFDGEVVGIFPEKGIYAPSPEMTGEYLTMLKINGYAGFESSGGGDLTWDGDTTGLDSVSLGETLYAISNSAPTIEQVQAGGYIKCSTVEGEIPFTSDNVQAFDETGAMFVLSVMRSADDDFGVMLLFVTQDNYTYTEGDNSVTFSKKGIYAFDPVSMGDYVTLLHIDGFSFGGGKPKKPTSYPPGGADTVTWDGNTSGKPVVEISDDIQCAKVSDAIPTLEDVKKGGVVKVISVEGTDEMTFTSSDVSTYYGEIVRIYDVVYVVPYDGFKAGEVVFPSAGVYFKKLSSINTYVSLLTLNDYRGFEGGSEWSKTEPAFEEGKNIYSTVCTVYNDDSFEYSDVSLSAASVAANKALEEANKALEEASKDKVSDIQIDGTSILDENGVANIPFANAAGMTGVVPVGDLSEGQISVVFFGGKPALAYPVAKEEALRNEKWSGETGSGVVDATNFHLAVKIAMTNGGTFSHSWTDDEKAAARERIDAVSTADYTTLIDALIAKGVIAPEDLTGGAT